MLEFQPSDWLKTVTWLLSANKDVQFQRSVNLCRKFFIGTDPEFESPIIGSKRKLENEQKDQFQRNKIKTKIPTKILDFLWLKNRSFWPSWTQTQLPTSQVELFKAGNSYKPVNQARAKGQSSMGRYSSPYFTPKNAILISAEASSEI